MADKRCGTITKMVIHQFSKYHMHGYIICLQRGINTRLENRIGTDGTTLQTPQNHAADSRRGAVNIPEDRTAHARCGEQRELPRRGM
jgi:hypothetical protein